MDKAAAIIGAVPIWDEAALALRRELLRRGAPAGGGVVPEPAPFVSIVVLNFNGAETLGVCLRHLYAQSYPDFELIVVDNGSSDESLEILKRQADPRLVLLCSPKNLGVAGGRNLALGAAKGEVAAFMDNDGYADRDWLSECLKTLLAYDTCGAVGSLVFFRKNRLVLNGAGGTVNLQGYGGDLCYASPYEFSTIPEKALFPMGCGMVVRREALTKVGSLDPVPIKWFDDVELGMRLWMCGYEVRVAKAAVVDHDLRLSDDKLTHHAWKKAFLFERARLRQALKYQPFYRFFGWFLREIMQLCRLRGRALLSQSAVWVLAWLWNIRHLGSALRHRVHWRRNFTKYLPLVEKSWGRFPPPTPPDERRVCDPASAGCGLICNGREESALHYGWYPTQQDARGAFRWTAAASSTFFRLSEPMQSLVLHYRPARSGQRFKLVLRPAGKWAACWAGEVVAGATSPQEYRADFAVSPGLYELLIICDETARGRDGQEFGLAIYAAAFSTVTAGELHD